MSLNLKKLNSDFDKKMNEILDNMSIEYLKNLFKEKILRKKKIEEVKEEEPEEKEYIDFPMEVSKEVIDLKRKFEKALYQDDDQEEAKEEKNKPEELSENEKIALLLNFIRENVNDDLKIPKNQEILNSVNISEWELRTFKNQLVEDGYLEKLNERVYVLKD